MAGDFPNDDSLCEHCGYPLKGMAADRACPECGLTVELSDPIATRPGLPIQQRFTFANVLDAYRAVIFHPRDTFRLIRIDGGLANEQLFLTLNCVLTALLFEAVRLTGWCSVPAFLSFFVFGFSHLMIALEAIGVRFFSRRRQWRVDLRLAQRIAALSSVGWIPVGPFLAFAIGAYQHGWLDQRWIHDIEQMLPNIDFFIGVIAYTVAILWFETLVGVGVRKVRFGNRLAWVDA